MEHIFAFTPFNQNITLNGQSSITLSVGDTYSEAGATANDNVDGNLTNNIVITGSVDTSDSNQELILEFIIYS